VWAGGGMHLEAGFDWSVMCRLLAHRDLAATIHFRADVIAARHHPLAGGLRNIRAIASKVHVADALQDRIAVTKYDFKTPS